MEYNNLEDLKQTVKSINAEGHGRAVAGIMLECLQVRLGYPNFRFISLLLVI